MLTSLLGLIAIDTFHNAKEDNANARKYLATNYNRPSLHLRRKENGNWDKLGAHFCIDRNGKQIILKWFTEISWQHDLCLHGFAPLIIAHCYPKETSCFLW